MSAVVASDHNIMQDGGSRAGVTVARALGSPTRSEIYAHLREVGEERTVRDVAARFELHPNVARTHLELLADAGLVKVGRRKHAGGGRPAKIYLAVGDGEVLAPAPPLVRPAADPALLVRLLATLLDGPGVDGSGRVVVAASPRATLAGRAHEAAVAEGRRLVRVGGGVRPDRGSEGLAARADGGQARADGGRAAGTPGRLAAAAAAAVLALRPFAPDLRVIRAGEDWVDIAGLRELFALLLGVRAELADALERGLLAGAMAGAGTPVTLQEAGLLPDGAYVWRARPLVAPSARTVAEPSRSLDARGLPRETGVVHAMREVTRLRAGEVLEVLAEGPGAPAAFARWVDRAGHELLGVERATDDTGRPAIRLLIRKGR